MVVDLTGVEATVEQGEMVATQILDGVELIVEMGPEPRQLLRVAEIGGLDDLVEFLKSLPFEDPEPQATAAGIRRIGPEH